MKTTIDVSDDLLEQAKQSARAQGISLRTLFERGLQLALQPAPALSPRQWPDLTYQPRLPGNVVSPERWRDVVNEAADGTSL